MKIKLTDDAGQVHDVTEAVQIVYDALTASMDYGSGFLDWEEVAAIKALAVAGGFEQPDYPAEFCDACHHDLDMHRGARYAQGPGNKTTYVALPCRHIAGFDHAVKPWPTMEERLCGCENGGPDIRPRYARKKYPDEPVAQVSDNGARA